MSDTGANPDRLTFSLASNWTSDPTDSSRIAQGASSIRATRQMLLDLLSQEHLLDVNAEGVHALGSARVYISASAPDAATDGRIWVNPATKQAFVSLEDAWVSINTGSTGQIAWFPRNAVAGWLICDGRTLTTATGLDSAGNTVSYSALITFLNTPYTSAFLPDLRGRFIRGVSVDALGVDPQSHLRVTSGMTDRQPRANYDISGLGWYDVFSEQFSALMDHLHMIDHTHGADSTNGYNAADSGRTGAGTWSGSGTYAGANDGMHQHNFSAVLTRGSSAQTSNIGFADVRDMPDASIGVTTENTEGENATIHHHAIERYYGLSRLAGHDFGANQVKGIPARDTDVKVNSKSTTLGDGYKAQGFPVNVALWPMIKV